MMPASSHSLFVSVVICTRNRASLLRGTLERFLTLTVPSGLGWELLVVDNGSTDTTAQVVTEYATRLPLRGLVEPVTGLSAARNRAVAEAAGTYVLWTDDDVLVDQDWLTSFVTAAAKYPRAAAFGGIVEPWFAEPPDQDYVDAFLHLRNGFCGVDFDAPEGPLEAPHSIVGANMAFRRDALGTSPFDPDLGFTGDALIGGEEADLLARIRRSGGQVVWIPSMRVRHYVPRERMSLGYILRYYEGRGRAAVRLGGFRQGRRVAGAPLWAVRRLVETGAEWGWARLTGQRVRALEALAAHHHLRGVVRQSLISTSNAR
ncbi:MAG: glycosyltransferase [Vicinamibacterales bacterium]